MDRTEINDKALMAEAAEWALNQPVSTAMGWGELRAEAGEYLARRRAELSEPVSVSALEGRSGLSGRREGI